MANDTLERLREHVDPRWSRAKVERELDAVEERVAARASRRLYLSGAVVFAGATLVMLMASRDGSPTSEPLAIAPPALAPALAPPSPEPQHEPAPVLAANDSEPNELLPEQDAGSEPDTTPRHARRQRRHHDKRVKAAQSRVVVAALAWQTLARDGRYREAWLALSREGLDRQRTDIDDLLLAGDAARLSGHAREAVPYYRDALARAGQGPRAHLSAFTLGRTLLHDLKDARGAAQAFARAYAAAPRGQLAEEALAGEADSWTRAGDRERARSAAQRYLVSFPHGRRAKDMERVAKAP